MSVAALLVAVWHIEQSVFTLTQVAACNRATSQNILPTLDAICRYEDPLIALRVLNNWSRVTESFDETSSESS